MRNWSKITKSSWRQHVPVWSHGKLPWRMLQLCNSTTQGRVQMIPDEYTTSSVWFLVWYEQSPQRLTVIPCIPLVVIAVTANCLVQYPQSCHVFDVNFRFFKYFLPITHFEHGWRKQSSRRRLVRFCLEHGRGCLELRLSDGQQVRHLLYRRLLYPFLCISFRLESRCLQQTKFWGLTPLVTVWQSLALTRHRAFDAFQ